MNISSIASATSSYATGSHTSVQQSAKSQKISSLKPLQTALNSGDISAAKQAFSDYKKSLQSVPAVKTSSSSGKTNDSANDLQSLDDALQGNNLSAAKQAYASLQHDVQKARQSRGGTEKTESSSAKVQAAESKHVKISVPANAVSQQTPSAVETLLDAKA